METIDIQKEQISDIPEAHYLKVEEVREEYLKDKSSTISWDDFEKQLVEKYNF